MIPVGGDEGDVVVFGVVLVDIHHHSLVAEGLRRTIDLHLAKGVPAVDFVALILFFVGVDEIVDPVAKINVSGSGLEGDAEGVVLTVNGRYEVVADVGKVLDGLFNCSLSMS